MSQTLEFTPRWASQALGHGRSLLAAGLAGLLVACAQTGGVAPQARLTEPAQLDLSGAIASAARDVAWPQIDWWARWQDPQLDALVRQSVAQHPDLKVAQARLADAQAQARIAGAGQSVQGGRLRVWGVSATHVTPHPRHRAATPSGATAWAWT